MLRDVHTAHFFHPATLEATLWALNKISVIIIALAALGCWQFVEGGHTFMASGFVRSQQGMSLSGVWRSHTEMEGQRRELPKKRDIYRLTVGPWLTEEHSPMLSSERPQVEERDGRSHMST